MQLTDAQKQQFIRDGYVRVPGLLPVNLVAQTKMRLLESLGIHENDLQTWQNKPSYPDEDAVLATTVPARTPTFEMVAEQLVGPDFLRGVCYSPFLDERNKHPVIRGGFIPVLTYPTPSAAAPRTFTPPARSGYHIDGGDPVTTWPGLNFLAVMAYLSDTPAYGGATVVRPGSHRQVFAHWVGTGDRGSRRVPDLPFADPVPVEARAGDVVFMHYLLVHSGSANHADHIRVGMNTAVMPNPARPYRPQSGPPQPGWTPLDHTLRTDNIGKQVINAAR